MEKERMFTAGQIDWRLQCEAHLSKFVLGAKIEPANEKVQHDHVPHFTRETNRRVTSLIRGSLSNNDGYGYERCIQAASTLSRLFHLVQFVKCCHFFWSWNLKECIEVQEKKNKVFASPSPAPGRCLVSTFSTNREIRNFHVVVEQWRQRNVLKRSVMLVQGFCLANLNLLFFCRSRWCRGRRCLKHWVFFSLEPIIDYVPIYGPLVQKFNVSFLLNPPTHIKSSPALK